MKISATSALVLNWTDPALWKSPEAIAYNQNLDVSEGEKLFQLFSAEESFMHLQSVSGRKYFMKNTVCNFLDALHKQDLSGQVLILAAGLAPLSIEIASLFPSCQVFDVDKYLMHDKHTLVNGEPQNIEFIACDITDLSSLQEQLTKHDFNKDKPSIAVMEGIIYYLPLDGLKSIMKFLRQNHMAFACDICLKPELVHVQTRKYVSDVFRKIKDEVGLDFINFYSAEEITSLLEDAGYTKIRVTNMQHIQKERTGDQYPFTETDSCWVMTVYAE